MSALVGGIISFMWHDSELWQHLHGVEVPLAAIIVGVFAVAQVAGGIGMPLPRATGSAAILLGLVYLIFSLACIPGMIAAPRAYSSYVDFFELFAIVCGAAAAYAATESDAARAASIGRAARIGLGVCAISFALAQIVYLKYTASLVPTWIPLGQTFWTNFTTIAFAAAATALLIGRQVRLACGLMALMLALFGVLVWVPHIAADPRDLSNWSEIAENYLITAAAWLVSGLSVF